ncbi:MAG: von Willebrand factor type A domain-containing protein [Rubritalea sp.]
MENENNLIDSLLKEHAKNKGVDEKFLSELENKIDAAERGNVIPIDQSSGGSGSSRRGLGLGIGVAACAAFYLAGSTLWKDSSNSEVIALESEAADQQIEDAKNSLPEIQGARYAREDEPKMSNEIKKKPSVLSADKAKAIASRVPSTRDVVDQEMEMQKKEGKDFAATSKDKYLAKEASLRSKSVDKLNEIKGKRQPALLAGKALSEASPIELAASSGFGDSVAEAGLRRGLDERTRQNGMLLGRGRSIEGINAEQYGKLIENDFTAPVDKETKRSTFAIDVDTASYANVRRLITAGNQVPADSVRIEEMINYFDYQYGKPVQNSKHPFAVHVDAAACPWNENNKLVRIALQGKEIIREERPASNVVFLLDVSGSMNRANKLPLLKKSLKYLLEEMSEEDTISIVVYAGASGLVLPATKVDDAGRVMITKAMEKLSAGGSTAGGAGIKLAYKIAQENFIKGGVNRVILATDGDFNVGVSDPDELTDLVKERAGKGVDISVLGFGTGNLNDNMLELITNNGNGNYSYIDTIKEGRKVLLEDMMGTLVTIAKDVKIQVEFNPEKVKEYRLIGYSNRMLPNAAFLDKKADAGEIGAGHRVTAFYEIVPGVALDKSKLDGLRYGAKNKAEVKAKKSTEALKHVDELLFVKLAYKQPEQKVNDESTYLSVALKDNDKAWGQVDDDFKFAASVALFGMVLRDSEHSGDGDLDLVKQLAESGKGADGKGLRTEFIHLVNKMKERKIEKRNR